MDESEVLDWETFNILFTSANVLLWKHKLLKELILFLKT